MRINVELYRGLVIQEAYKVWSRLPKHTRAWIGLDDVVETGMLFTWWTYRTRWSANGGASFGTYVKSHLPKHFDNCFIAPYQQAQCRSDVNTVSLQALQEWYKAQSGQDAEIDYLFPVDPALPDCLVTQLVFKIYGAASEELRAQMIKWFLRPSGKVSVSGQKFKRHKKEFQKIAKQFGAGLDEFRHFMHSRTCLDAFSRMTFGIPYDINDPTPDLREYQVPRYPVFYRDPADRFIQGRM